MAKKPVTLALRPEDLARLDAFASARRLSRGEAVGMLLDLERGSHKKPLVEPVTARSAQPDVGGAYTVTKGANFEKNEVPEPDQAKVSDQVAELQKQMKLEATKMALRMTEKKHGVTPVEVVGDEVVKRDPYAYDDYDQSGGDQ